MKNKIFVTILALIMVLSCAITSYAAASTDESIEPRETSNVIFYIQRLSGTTAQADVTVHFSSQADEYNVVVYLQKLVNGSWVNDNKNDEYVFYNNGFNSSSMLFSHKYTSLTYGTTYRLMVISRDKRGEHDYRKTTTSDAF